MATAYTSHDSRALYTVGLITSRTRDRDRGELGDGRSHLRLREPRGGGGRPEERRAGRGATPPAGGRRRAAREPPRLYAAAEDRRVRRGLGAGCAGDPGLRGNGLYPRRDRGLRSGPDGAAAGAQPPLLQRAPRRSPPWSPPAFRR